MKFRIHFTIKKVVLESSPAHSSHDKGVGTQHGNTFTIQSRPPSKQYHSNKLPVAHPSFAVCYHFAHKSWHNLIP